MPKALNGETVRVNLQFTADTAQAKRELRQLQDTLKSITRDPAQGFGLSKEFAEASRYAAELQVHLQKAINPQSGMLDFARLNESIKKSGMSLSAYGDKLISLGPQGRQAFSQLATAVSQSEIPVRRVNSALAQMGTVLKNTIRWQLSSTAIHAFSGAVQTAYNYAKDLNESLNNIRIVTGQNIDQMEKFAATANKAAKALSTSTLDYTNAALIYYQQGLNDKEVEARTNVTMKVANVTRQSAEEVSNQLTAIWNNYAKGAENLEYYADVITALGAATASSSQEITTGLEKFAAVGETVGLSYEYATAALATVTATTRQSAEVVGNAFKTLFARLQGLKLGETQDDGTDLNKYSTALMQVGVNIKDASGNLKDMDAILEETAAKWRTLGKDQQMALAQTVAGVRQYTQFVALMDNWGAMQKNLSIAKNSSGELQKQQDTYAEGWEAAAKRVKTAWEDVYKSLINDEFFIDLLNFIEKAVKGIKNLIGAMGGIPGILTTIGSLVMTVFNKQMAEGLTNMTYSIRSLTAHGRQKMIQERQGELNKMSAAATNAPGMKDTIAGETWANNLRQQVELQGKLAQNSDKINETERFVFASLMDQVKARQQLAAEAAKEVDKAQQLLNMEIKEQKKGKDSSKYDTAYNNWQANKDSEKKVLMSWGQIGNESVDFKALMKYENQTAKNYSNGQTRKQIKDYVNNLLNSFETELSQSPQKAKIEQAKKELFDLNPKKYKTTAQFNKAFQEKLNTLLQEIKGAETTEGAQATQQFEEEGGMVEKLIPLIRELAEAKGVLAGEEDNVKTAVQNTNQFLEEATQKTMMWQESFVATGQVVMSIGMLFNQINGVLDTMSNKDIPLVERLLTSATSFGMIMPMILNTYHSLAGIISTITAKQMTSLALSMQEKVLAGQHLNFIEKRLLTQGLGIKSQQTELLLEMAQKGIQTDKLTDEQKELLLRTGILTETELETGAISGATIAQKLFNAATLSNPYIAIAAIIIATLITIGTILKRNAQHAKEEAEAERKANEETLSKANEKIQKLNEEQKAYDSLVSSIKDAIAAYDGTAEAKNQIYNATKDLLDTYQVEGASLALLQGNYKELNRLLDENAEKKRQNRLAEIKEALKPEHFTGAELSGFNTQYTSFTQDKAEWVDQSYELLSDKDKQYLQQTQLPEKGEYYKEFAFKDIEGYEDVLGNYEAISNYIKLLLKQGFENTDPLIKQFKERLEILQPYIDQIKDLPQEMTDIEDTSLGYQTMSQFSSEEQVADINNVKNAVDKLSQAYHDNGDDIATATSKAKSYLATQGQEWQNALTRYTAIEEKYRKGQGGGRSPEELLTLYNKLSTDAERMVFFQISFKAGASDEEILDTIRHGKTGIEMEIHTANAKALAEATNNFKKNMSVQETKDWASKYGVAFGDENSTLGIELRDFMGMSDTQKQAYLANKTLEQQNLAYEKSKQYYKENKNKEDTEEKSELLERRTELENLRDTTTDASILQGINEAIQYVNSQLDQVETRLTEAENNMLEGESRKLLEFTSALEKAKDIKLGDSISQEELNNFTDGIDESLSDYFVQNADGTWKLVVSELEFKEDVRNALAKKAEKNPLTEAEQRSVAEMATTYNELGADQDAFGINSNIMADNIQRLALQYDNCSYYLDEYRKAVKASGKDSGEANKAFTALIKQLKAEEFKKSAKNIKEVADEFKKLSKEAQTAAKASTYQKIRNELKNIFGKGFEIDDATIDAHWADVEKIISGDQKLAQEGVDAFVDEYKDGAGKVELIRDNLAADNAEAFSWTITLDNGNAIKVANEWTQILDSLDKEVKAEIVLKDGSIDVKNVLTALANVKDGAALASTFLKTVASSDASIDISNIDKIETALSELQSAEKDSDAYFVALGNYLKVLDGFSLNAKGNADITVPDNLGPVSGGGGGSKAETHKQEEKRYEYETEVLSDLEKQLDRIGKAKERAWGKDRVKLIDQEIAALEKEEAIQKDLVKSVNEYLGIDQSELLFGKENAFEITPENATAPVWQKAKGLKDLGINAQLDEYGNIINIEEIRQALLDYYNAGVDAKNAGGKQEDFDIVKGNYDWIIAQLEKYNETVNKRYDEENKLLDLRYQKQDKYEEKLQHQIEYRIQLEQNNIDMLNNKIKIFGDNFYKSAEVFGYISTKLKDTISNSSLLQEDYEHWTQLYKEGKISQTAYQDHLQEIFESAGTSIEDIKSAAEEYSQYYSNILNNFDTMLKRETKGFDKLIDNLEYYNELLALSGREMDYDTIGKILSQEQAVLKERIEVDQRTQTFYQNEYNRLKEAYDKAESEEAKALLLPSLEAAEEKLDEINDKVKDDIKQAAELANKEFSNSLDRIYHNFEYNVTDNLGFDYLSQTMDLASQRAEDYLTKTNQIYETTSLLRDINKDINKTDSQYAKTRLSNFASEITSLQEKSELSHYELEDAKARYEILKAQIALEEAQNAKSTVRLQRDSEGNYGYVYTADQDKVAEAEANLAKAENDRYNLAIKTQEEYLRKFYQTEQQANEALRKLDEDAKAGRIKSKEEYERRKAEIIEYYSGILLSYETIGNKALEVVNDTSAQHINDTWTNTFGSKENGNGLIGLADKWKQEAVSSTEEVDKALGELKKDLDENVTPTISTLEEELEDADTQASNLKTSIDNLLDKTEPVVQNIGIEMTGAFNNLAASIKQAYDNLLELQQQISNDKLATYKAIADDGKEYTIHSARGNWFIENSESGDMITGSDGSVWTNENGIITVEKKGKKYYYNQAAKEDSNPSPKYIAYDKAGNAYNIGSDTGIKFIEDPSQTEMKGGNESLWTKDANGVVTIQKADGSIYKYGEKWDNNNQPENISKDENNQLNAGAKVKVKEAVIWGTIPMYDKSGYKNANGAFMKTDNNGTDNEFQINSYLDNDLVELQRINNGGGIFYTKKEDLLKYFEAFLSGGYTGSWAGGSDLFGGKLAMLHEKELVLNQEDTKNMLASIQIIRELAQAIDLRAAASSLSSNLSSIGLNANSQVLEQQVTIHAEFPNAIDHNEIEQAFTDLVNKASQYANRY